MNLHLCLSPFILQRESINQISIFTHGKDFASPFIFTSVTMMMHLMPECEMSKDTPISPGRLSFYFYPKYFTLPKAGVFELGIFNQASADLPDKCLEICPFVDWWA